MAVNSIHVCLHEFFYVHPCKYDGELYKAKTFERIVNQSKPIEAFFHEIWTLSMKWL